MNEEQRAKKRAYNLEWGRNNWESRKASQYRWREKNLERVKEIDRKCYAETKSKDKAQRMLQAARYRAKIANLPFNITKADIVIPEHCPVLPWIKLDTGEHSARPELDKVSPEKGYVKGNVQVISSRANRIKADASLEELELIVNYIKSYPISARAPSQK